MDAIEIKILRDRYGDRRSFSCYVCPVCKEKFWKPSHKKNIRTCSHKCFGVYQTVRIVVNCTICNKPAERTPSQIANLRTGLMFCSVKCKVYAQSIEGANIKALQSKRYAGGYRAYRKRAIRFYGAQCSNTACELAKCGIQVSKKMLDVHHIDWDRSNGGIKNLAVLCAWCHALITRNSHRKAHRQKSEPRSCSICGLEILTSNRRTTTCSRKCGLQSTKQKKLAISQRNAVV